MKKAWKTIIIVLVLITAVFIGHWMRSKQSSISSEEQKDNKKNTEKAEKQTKKPEAKSLIVPEGNTLESRINPPEGYKRKNASADSFTEFMRKQKLKPDGSRIMLYNGTEKGYQDAQAAVFAMDIGDKDLQQCADSVFRVYAEYLWKIGKKDAISFHLTNGFLMDYPSWRSGKRLAVNGNTVSWTATAGQDNSYQSFRKYLEQVMVYAGTLSLQKEGKPIQKEDLKPGDMLIKGGSPGHVVLVIDMAENGDGRKCFLLAQGYMPAQDFHVLKNPKHEENPWYETDDFTAPIRTPEYTFEEGSIQRPDLLSASPIF